MREDGLSLKSVLCSFVFVKMAMVHFYYCECSQFTRTEKTIREMAGVVLMFTNEDTKPATG